MSLLQPLALLAAVTLPAIVVLYMLKKRTRPRTVSSVMLWQRLDRLRTPALNLSRLLRNLLLALQLLIAALLVLALARPALERLGGEGRDVIIILDTSAAMAVETGRETRLDAALAQVASLVAAKGPGDAMGIVAAGAEARVICGITTSAAALADSLAEVAVTSSRFNLAAALVLAENMALALDNPEIVVFSVGIFESVKYTSSLPLTWVAPPREDVTNLALENMTADGGRLYVTVFNNGTTPASAPVRVFAADGSLAGQRQVELAPGQRQVLVWHNLAPSPWYKGEIGGDDMLSLDNEHYVLAAPPTGNRLMLVSAGNLFLERSLMLNPDIRLSRVTPDNYRDEMSVSHDIFVFDGFLPPQLPAGPVLVFDPPHPNPHFATSLPQKVSQMAEGEHLLLAHADFSEVRIGYGKALGGGRVLLASDIGPLAVVIEDQGLPRVVLGFPVQAGDLPLRPAFPIFIRNVLDYFTHHQPVVGQLEYGSQAVIQPARGIEEMALIWPDGRREQVAPPLPWRGPVITEAGIYYLESDTGRLPVAVNPPLAVDGLAVPETVELGGQQLEGRQSAGGAVAVLAPLLLAALGVMALEWWVDNNV